MSAGTTPGRRGRPPRTAGEPPAPSAAPPFDAASPEARRLAAAILEVLAGVQLPGAAARSLGLSVARYYQLELRAVGGLVAACEPRRPGRAAAAGEGVAGLRRECERLRQECARHQALARAARRALGGAAPPPTPEPAPEPGRKRRRRRRPTARALKMAALLQPPTADAAPEGPSAAPPPPDAAPACPGPGSGT